MAIPICSIVIPCYNQIDFLNECLQSVLAQTFSDWEAIVVDDASTIGNVEEVLKCFPDPRIRFIRHPQNKGLGASRNTGILAGSGKFILPLDCDDQLAPEFLERLVRLLENHPEIDCAFPDFEMFGARKGIIKNEIRDVPFLLHDQWIPGPGILICRSLYKRVGGYCEDKIFRNGNEDWDFWLSAAEKNFKPTHIPEPLYLYNRHSGSLSSHLRKCDYLTREAMYTRHSHLFDTYRAGGDFLAVGYLLSGWVNFKQKDYRSACQALWAIFRPQYRKIDNRFLALCLIPSLVLLIVKKAIKKLNIVYLSLVESLAQNFYNIAFTRKLYWNLKANAVDQRYGLLTHDYDTLRSLITTLNPQSILDVGCGSGRLFPLYLSLGIHEIVGQDIASTSINLARARYKNASIRLVSLPVTDLSYANSFFDLAICNRVLQHVPEKSLPSILKAICKMSRMVYVNEINELDIANHDKKIFIHDYAKLFNEIGYCVREEGIINSKSKPSQKWVLYAKA